MASSNGSDEPPRKRSRLAESPGLQSGGRLLLQDQIPALVLSPFCHPCCPVATHVSPFVTLWSPLSPCCHLCVTICHPLSPFVTLWSSIFVFVCIHFCHRLSRFVTMVCFFLVFIRFGACVSYRVIAWQNLHRTPLERDKACHAFAPHFEAISDLFGVESPPSGTNMDPC